MNYKVFFKYLVIRLIRYRQVISFNQIIQMKKSQ